MGDESWSRELVSQEGFDSASGLNGSTTYGFTQECPLVRVTIQGSPCRSGDLDGRVRILPVHVPGTPSVPSHLHGSGLSGVDDPVFQASVTHRKPLLRT